MKRLVVIALSFIVLSAKGQEYRAEALLPAVDHDGFHRIMLTPELMPYVNNNFSNIRILDKNGVQVPYLMEKDRETASSTEFIPYTIEEKTILPDSCTILVLKNDDGITINNINLVIRNAAIYKEAELYGSDDGESWYALRDRFSIGLANSTEATSEIKIIDFPASDYKWYKLRINDKGSAPLNILQAGYYMHIPQAIRYEEVPVRYMEQDNDLEKKKSTVWIWPDTMRVIDRISWTISGTPYYQRQARLYTNMQARDHKGDFVTRRIILAEFQVNSRHEAVLYLPEIKLDNLILEIENGDNPPLKVDEIKFYQVNRYLVAWLEQGETYKIAFGEDDMPVPNYDLANFRDSIPALLTSVQPGAVQPILSAEEESTTIFTTKLFIWVAIAVVIVVLGLMSIRMMREAKGSE